MDWIEKLFGIAPDNGDGSAEAAIVLAVALVVAAMLSVRLPRIRAYFRRRMRH